MVGIGVAGEKNQILIKTEVFWKTTKTSFGWEEKNLGGNNMKLNNKRKGLTRLYGAFY